VPKLVHDPETVRLGKHRGVVIDPRTLQFAKYAAAPAALPPIPKTVAVTTKVPLYPMFGNDRYGDCTCASTAHGMLARSTREGHPVTLTDSDVLDLYARVNGGYDQGAYMLDVLNELRNVGIAGHKIGAFVKLDLSKWDHIKLAVKLFGGVYLGAALPIAAQYQTKWVVPKTGTTGDGAPGSWGGHAIEILWATDSSVKFPTWTEIKTASKEWVQTYGDEAYAVLDPLWFGDDPHSPQGFDLEQLTADLAAI
jgi:hypothetical protein